MAEELDVGGIVATVRIDTEKADSALNSVINALSKFATAIETAIAAVEKVSGKTDTLAAAIDKVGEAGNTATSKVAPLAPAVEQVNTASSSAAQSISKLNTAISSTAPDKYSAKVTKINNSLEAQRQKVTELYAELDKMQEVYVEAEIGMGHDVTDYNPLGGSEFTEIISQIDKEEAKLHELQTQLAAVTAEREKSASAAVSASQKQASAVTATASAQNKLSAATTKQSEAFSDSGMIIDTSATALRAVTSAAGGTASKVGYLATELMYLKRSMQAATTAASAMGGVISFVVMAAITIVTSAITSMKEAEEKRQEAFAEGVENYKKYSEELRALEQNISVLNDSKSTTEQLATARNNLVSSCESLIVGYTEEGEAILATKEQMEDYIESLKEAKRLERESIIEHTDTGLVDGIGNAITQLKEDIKNYEELRDEYTEHQKGAEAEGNLSLANQYKSLAEDVESGILMMEDSINGYKDKYGEYKEYFSAVLESELEVASATDGLSLKFDDLSGKTAVAAEAIKRDVVGKIVGGLMTCDEAVEEYNKLMNDTSYVDSYYQNLISQSQNATVETERQAKAAQQLAEAYDNVNSAVSNAMSGLGGVQSDMASAFAELSENGKLTQSTVNSLIGSYPELIDYLNAETGQLELTEGVMRELYDIQKELRIAELEASKAKLAENEAEIQSNYALAESRLSTAKAAFLQNGGRFSLEFFSAMNEYSDAQKELEQLEANYSRIEKLIGAIRGMELDLSGSSGSGSSSVKNSYSSAVSEYSEALEKINHKKRMERLTTEQEIAALEELGEKYSLTADEQMDLEYRLYSAKKQYREELEKARSEALNKQYEQISNLKALDKLTAEEELERLQKIQKTHQMNAEERIALEIKIHNLKQELYQEEINALDDLGDAVTEALKAQYEAQRAAEEERINESIEKWNDWEKATVANIQAEIDALEALEKEQESQAAAAEFYKKSQELKLKIAYEKDDYQREQYEKELNRLAKKEQERLQKEQFEEKKTELQNKIENVQSTADARREALNAELEVISENYDELTSALSLRAQAEQMIMQQSQKDIVSLITSYAPDYNLAGQSIGESLYNGVKEKVDSIYSYVADVMTAITDYQERAKAVATQAADDFEAAYRKNQSSSSIAKTTVVNYTSNFNTPVQSPVQTKRAIESTASSIAAMIQ